MEVATPRVHDLCVVERMDGPGDPDGSHGPHGIHRIYSPLMVSHSYLCFSESFSLAHFPVLPDSASVPMSSSISSFQQDPLILYSKTLHDYTLELWTESRRIAEEKARRKLAAMEEEARKQSYNSPTTERPRRS